MIIIMSSNGKRTKSSRRKKKEYSKKVVSDIRSLLWIVTLGGLFLAYLCIDKKDTSDHFHGYQLW